MKRTKRFLASFLCLLMILTASPFSAFAAESSTGTDPNNPEITCTFDIVGHSKIIVSGTGEFSGYVSIDGVEYDIQDLSMTYRELYIEEGITSLGYAMFNNTDFEYIYVPNSLEEASYDNIVFGYCYNLKSVHLPSGLKKVNDSMFRECQLLSGVDIPDGVTTIGNSAFYACSNLTEIELPKSVALIGELAFYGCSNLTKVNLPEGLQIIRGNAFASCPLSGSLVLPKSLRAIGNSAFAGTDITELTVSGDIENTGTKIFNNSLLTSVNFTQDVTKIPNNLFQNAYDLKTVEFTDNITEIGANAFESSGLTQIVFPKNLQSIGEEAFYKCSSLASITLNDSLASIGDSAFESTGLNEVYIPADVTLGKDCFASNPISTVTFAPGRKTVGGFAGCSSLENVVIPDGVQSIDERAFYNCRGIFDIEIPDSVTEIGNYAFYGCTYLENVKLSENLTSIGNYAFNQCKAITSIDLPDSLTSIGNYAFYKCTGLTDVVLPKNLVSIGISAFGFTKIKEVTIPASLETTDVSGVFENTPLEKVVLPEGLTSVPDSMFDGCDSLTTVVFPESLTSIGAYAFRNTALASVVFPENLETIGSFAFANCDSLSEIVFNNNLKSVGESAFERTAIKEINIPAGVDFAQNSFSGSKLEKVTFAPGVKSVSGFSECDYLVSVEIPEGVEEISAYAFANCFSLSSVTLPDSLVTIGESAFDTCQALENIELPKNLKVIGDSAFYQSCLNSLELPEGIESIGTGAFYETPITGVVNVHGAVLAPSAFANSTLTGVVFETNGETLTIPERAFYNCTNLQSVQLPENVKVTAGPYAFAQCAALSDINLENMVKADDHSFYQCSSLAQIKLEALTEIGAYAFSQSGLKSVTVPATVTKMGDYAFASCKSLNYVNVKCSKIGNYAFADCSSVNDYYLSSSIKSIPSYSIASVKLNNSYIYLRTCTIHARYGSYAISFAKSKTIPYEELLIDDETQLPESYIGGKCGDGTWAYDVSENTLYIYAKNPTTTYVTESGENWSPNTVNIKRVVFSDEVVNISARMFENYSELESISFGKNVTTIGDQAFEDCTSLKKIEGGSGVKTIGTSSFSGCVALTEPFLPASLETVGVQAFYGCKGFKSIIIPDNVKTLSSKCFMDCTNVTGIEIGSGVTTIPSYCFANSSSLKDITFSENLQFIGERAFENAIKLIFINIPDSVTTIGAYAFNNCLNVEKITLGSSVSDIRDYAFNDCVNCYELNLNSVIRSLPNADYTRYHIEYYCGLKPIIPSSGMQYKPSYNSFTNIGENTTGLTVNIGDNVQSLSLFWLAGQTDMLTCVNIGSGVASVAFSNNSSTASTDASQMYNSQFIGNPNLKQINVSDDNAYIYSDGKAVYSKDGGVLYTIAPGLDTFSVNGSVKTIGSYAFAGNAALKKITFEEGVTSIANHAFLCCDSLKYITLPKTLTSIDSYAFENCAALRNVEIPDNVVLLGSYAFKDCSQLAAVILPDDIQMIDAYTFVNCTSLTGIVIPNSVNEIRQGAFKGCTALEEVYIGSQNLEFVSSSSDKTFIFSNCGNVEMYTMAGSDASVYAKECNIPCHAYTDEYTFADLCAMKLDIFAGYVGFCTEGHGDIEWLTVYEADCENDGYEIGVCEYCSEILDERHISACGHDYQTTRIEPTETTDGAEITTCENCGKSYCKTIPNLSGTQFDETHTVSGTVVIAVDSTAESGRNSAIGADIVIDGYTVATTDDDGNFSFELKSGTYEATVHYPYGFDRQIFIIVSDSDIHCGSIPIIGCDWNKDGRVDDADYTMFKLVFKSHVGTPSYLDYVDMNHDGYINARDMVLLERCMGVDKNNFVYPTLAFNK